MASSRAFRCYIEKAEPWTDPRLSGYKHYTEKVSLDALADQFFISKFYLTRVFKEQYGVSINTYVLNLRITKAKQMLRFTDKKLEDIGYQCGLGAPHYFSRIFKQVEGIAPSEFREKW